MSYSEPSRSELLQSVLQPLLDDFQYWFEQARSLLEEHDLPNLTAKDQSDLLARVIQAQQEVSAANTLFKSTGGQVGVDMPVVTGWHHLVAECWKASIGYRMEQAKSSDDDL